MDAVWPALPELPLDRLDPQAAPLWRAGHDVRVLEPFLLLLDAGLELLSAGDGLRLRGRPRADARVLWPCVKVDLGLFVAEKLGRPLDADLALELGPEKVDGGVRVGADVGALLGGVPVAVHNHGAVRGQLLEENDARRHAARWQPRRRQRHGLGHRDGRCGLRVLEPFEKLVRGVRLEVRLVERELGVLMGLWSD